MSFFLFYVDVVKFNSLLRVSSFFLRTLPLSPCAFFLHSREVVCLSVNVLFLPCQLHFSRTEAFLLGRFSLLTGEKAESALFFPFCPAGEACATPSSLVHRKVLRNWRRKAILQVLKFRIFSKESALQSKITWNRLFPFSPQGYDTFFLFCPYTPYLCLSSNRGQHKHRNPLFIPFSLHSFSAFDFSSLFALHSRSGLVKKFCFFFFPSRNSPHARRPNRGTAGGERRRCLLFTNVLRRNILFLDDRSRHIVWKGRILHSSHTEVHVNDLHASHDRIRISLLFCAICRRGRRAARSDNSLSNKDTFTSLFSEVLYWNYCVRDTWTAARNSSSQAVWKQQQRK